MEPGDSAPIGGNLVDLRTTVGIYGGVVLRGNESVAVRSASRDHFMRGFPEEDILGVRIIDHVDNVFEARFNLEGATLAK